MPSWLGATRMKARTPWRSSDGVDFPFGSSALENIGSSLLHIYIGKTDGHCRVIEGLPDADRFCRFRVHAVRENRRPGRRGWSVATRAGEARARGVGVSAVLCARPRHIEGEPKYLVRSLTIPFRSYNRFVGVVDGGKRDGVQYYFIDCLELFDRKELYGTSGGDYPDNAERFGLFCRAVIEASKLLGVPQVFHVHDWQAALIPVYLRTVYAADPALSGRGHCAHDSQRRVSGQVSARDHRATALSVGGFHHGEGGAVRPLQLFEGRRGLFRPADHREQEIRRGDSDHGVRRATGGRPAAARAPTCTEF